MILQNDLLKFFYNQQVVVEANKLGLGGGAEEMVGKGRPGRNKTSSERTFLFFFQIPIIPISSQANPVDEQDSHNQEERDEKKPEDMV